MNKSNHSRALAQLRKCLNRTTVERIARETKFLHRRRSITPFELVLALITSLGCGRCDSFADILRTFNFKSGLNVAYKPFHNQLSKPEFQTFMERLARHALSSLKSENQEGRLKALRRFDDILVQDGSSFRVHDALKPVFPRRFGHFGGKAGIEVHATMSLRSDLPTRLSTSADTTS